MNNKNAYKKFRDIISTGSRAFNFNGRFLRINDYYDDSYVEIDLYKITPEMFNELLVDYVDNS